MTDPRNPADKTVVITGASAGVGRAIACRFARAGARLGLIARDGEALETLKDELSGGDVKIHCVAADVSDPEAVFAAAEEIEGALGPISLWINNAMLTVFSAIDDITPEEFRKVTETTYLGYVHGTMAALRHMKPRNRGHIIQVGSSLAYRGIPLQSAYCGAKHAIRGFTDSLRCELLHDNSAIELTMVQLPAMNTPQFDWARTHMKHAPRPVPPVVEPQVAANAIYTAAVKPKREYWLDLSTAKVILGNMLVPRYVDHVLARRAYDAQMRKYADPPGNGGNLDAPVHDLHRMRGDFGNEARSQALLLSGDTVRLGLAALCLGILGGSIAATRIGTTRHLRK